MGYYLIGLLQIIQEEMDFPGCAGGTTHLLLQDTQDMRVQFLGWEGSPGEGNGNSLQHSCLENPMDRGAWRATGSE